MEPHAVDWAKVVLGFGLPFGLALAAMASATGLARAVTAAMEAMARQPEAAGKIQGAMILGCAFIEALTIYVFVTVILFGIGFLKV
ncbi:MAG: ATP synthase F0 subunit C [Candidatus Omnitrophica bacterium]|nr:ATP synthase F0 subunit C [Candidatus Omnitrophota bacterium]